MLCVALVFCLLSKWLLFVDFGRRIEMAVCLTMDIIYSGELF
jgi:hypothetical protein